MATKNLIHVTSCDTRAKQQETLNNMITSSMRANYLQLRQYYCSCDEVELGRRWTSWIRYGCGHYDVWLLTEYECTEPRWMLAASRTLVLRVKFGLPVRRPDADDEFPTCAVWTTKLYSKLSMGVCRKMEMSKLIIHITPNVSYCTGEC